jgi:hypothetical protein
LQTANIMVAIGGDRGNTVPKYGVSATEIAVLQAIHGPDAIFDVEPADDIEDGNRDELAVELKEVYTGARMRSLVEALYPGAAARVFENLDELDVTDEQYKAETRKKSRKSAEKAAPARRSQGSPPRLTSKRQEAVDKATEAGVARPQNQEDIEDGIGDMPDSGVLELKDESMARGTTLIK